MTARLALLAIVLAGAALRLHDLGTLPFWADEAYGWWTTRMSWAVLWDVIPRTDSHPAFYYSLLKLWMGLFGSGEAALRSLSALASIATIPLLYGCGRVLGDARNGIVLGLAAGALVATAPIQIEYAQEARPYALISLMAAVILLSTLWLFTRPAAATVPWLGWGPAPAELRPELGRARLAWAALGIAAGLAMWLHDLNTLMMAALAVAGLLWLRLGVRGQPWALRNGLLAGLLAVLVWSPGIPGTLWRTFVYSDDTWLPFPDWKIIHRGLTILFDVRPLRWDHTLATLAALALFGVVMLWRRRGPAVALALAALILVPVLLSLGISWTVRPVFLERTLLWTALPFYVALAAGLVLPLGRWVGGIAAALVVALFAYGSTIYHERKSKEPWDEMVQTVLEERQPDDLVLVMPEDVTPMVLYYTERVGRDLPFVILPLTRPEGLPAEAIAFFNQLQDADLAALADKAETARRVWILTRRPDIPDPDGRLLRLLDQDFTQVRAEPFYRTIVWLYLYERKPAAGTTPPGATEPGAEPPA